VIPIWIRRRSQDEFAIGLGVAFLAAYLVYHAFSDLAKFGGYGAIGPIYFTLLAVHMFMAFVVAVLVPVTFYSAMKSGSPPISGSLGSRCRHGFRPRRVCDGDPQLSDER
jgi:uncharacterized membrane protein YozB (DUF420 family)